VNRAGVLGSPIGHSLSPVLHRAAYHALGLTDWRYTAHEVDEAGLARFLEGLGPQWRGLSLTMPLKSAVLPLLDEVTADARALSSANTVLLADGIRRGCNTDVPGIVTAVRERGGPHAESVTVLGGGATGRSALAAAAALGATHAVVVVRDVGAHVGQLEHVGAAFGLAVDVRPWSSAPALLAAPLVVSTVPAAAAATLADALPRAGGMLFDVLYDPWPTPLARAWQGVGTVVGGLDLLVAQAVLQVELMTGSRPAPETLHAAGAAALAARGGR
jgi:shikimate dehydrogenase